MLGKKEVKQIEDYGLTLEQVQRQLEIFSRGIPFVSIVTTASIGNGIKTLGTSEQEKCANYYEQHKGNLDIVKFVPASGAATRMFQFLHQFLENFNPEKQLYRTYIKETESADVVKFFDAVSDFAFLSPLRKKIRKLFPEYKKSTKGQRYYFLAKALLEEDGLNYGNLPKGLIPFHKYKKYATTAFEEQLFEAAHYASAKDDVYLHFTFSEKHLDLFKEEFESIKGRVSRNTKKEFHISYSFQKKETDTIAVNSENKPYTTNQGALVFRPSGHGALLENLNDVNADIVFIKNIDNVTSQEYVEEIAEYKKSLAGKLLWLQDKIFTYLRWLEEDVSLEQIKEIQSFIWNELDVKDIPSGVSSLIEFLNRPIRVCGVVKNTGAPGGGPFWVQNSEGVVSLQIVEMSQIEMTNDHQKSIVNEATHFNPVDLVCGLRNYKGDKFDLMNFTDPDTGFISNKSENGIPIKALELPGLWNGSMAQWTTVFVEVPLITFNPVKTVNDLLKKEHRPNA